VTIPAGVTSIGKWAFADADNQLTSVTILVCVTYIDNYAFGHSEDGWLQGRKGTFRWSDDSKSWEDLGQPLSWRQHLRR